MALYTSKKNIIRIEFFMENFLDISYDQKEKLTHNVMKQFLLEKHHVCPKRVTFSDIQEPDILNGKVLLVKDRAGKTIGYRNPRLDFSCLLLELQKEKSVSELEKIRADILKAQNYILLNDNMIVPKEDEEPLFKGKNRDRKVMFKTSRHLVPIRRK